jgi:hypothetical protein
MPDRDLCLALAEALGWERVNSQEDWIHVDSRLFRAGWLLTPAGAFAVLEAMRGRGAGIALADRKEGRWEAYIYLSYGREGDVVHNNLARAIAEAAYTALVGL